MEFTSKINKINVIGRIFFKIITNENGSPWSIPYILFYNLVFFLLQNRIEHRKVLKERFLKTERFFIESKIFYK